MKPKSLSLPDLATICEQETIPLAIVQRLHLCPPRIDSALRVLAEEWESEACASHKRHSDACPVCGYVAASQRRAAQLRARLESLDVIGG